MINNGISMFGTTDILKRAMDASWKRNSVINENIANVDTPGYKRQEVAFEEYMRKALDNDGMITKGEARRVQPRVYTQNQQLSYRSDGNNVDIDTEMVYLAENQLKYDTLASQVNYNFQRLKAVIK